MRTVLLPLAALSLVACKEPVVAPAELNELSVYLFANWADEDPEVMAAGLVNLETWAATVAVESDNWADRSFDSITAPTAAEMEGLTNHGLDPSVSRGVGLAYSSAFGPEAHAGLIGAADQRPGEPASPDRYDRTIDGDADCFASGECETVASTNDIERRNVLFTVEYILEKAWRWVELEDGSKAMVARAWTPDSGTLMEDGKQVLQAYALEVWMPTATGSLRWSVTWQDAELGLDPETVDSLVAGSLNDAMNAQDELLAGE